MHLGHELTIEEKTRGVLHLGHEMPPPPEEKTRGADAAEDDTRTLGAVFGPMGPMTMAAPLAFAAAAGVVGFSAGAAAVAGTDDIGIGMAVGRCITPFGIPSILGSSIAIHGAFGFAASLA